MAGMSPAMVPAMTIAMVAPMQVPRPTVGANYLQEQDIVPERRIYQHISVFEEVGHGCSYLPAPVSEVLAVDMGCVGEGLNCTERQVSICAKDSHGPYHYATVSALVAAAEEQPNSSCKRLSSFIGNKVPKDEECPFSKDKHEEDGIG